MEPEHHLAVVGAGPAGLATAIAARLAGLTVCVLDRARGPVDKACGEGILPDGLAKLDELGVVLASGVGMPLRGIRYVDGDTAADGLFPGRPGLGLRRPELSAALLRRASELRIPIHWSRPVRALRPDGLLTDQGIIRSRWIAGADGLHSKLRTWTGLAGPPTRRPRYGIRRHYQLEPWTDLVEVHLGSGAEAYVAPVAPQLMMIALLCDGRPGSFDRLLERFPRLQQRLAGAPRITRDQGAGPLEQRVAGVVRGPVALVGDAAGYLDAISGEGLAVAFHQACALAAALRSGDLAAYGRAHRRLNRVPDRMTRLLLELQARPALRSRVVAALAEQPELFSRLLGVHTRSLPLHCLGLRALLRLLRRAGRRP